LLQLQGLARYACVMKHITVTIGPPALPEMQECAR